MPKTYHADRARIAALVRHRPDDHEAIDNARRAYRTERLADQIRTVVDQAPPLTDEQRTRLAALLRGNGAADA